MKKISFLMMLLSGLWGQAQEARTKVKEGNQAFTKGAYDQAEINYREALKEAREEEAPIAQYNLGNALYKQERWKEAKAAFEASLAETKDASEKADIYHNLGNVMMEEKELDAAIEAYKNALKNDPSDEETRFNLAKALRQKKKQEQKQQQNQEKQDQEQKDDQEKNQGQNKQDQEKKDQQKQDQQNEKSEQDQQKQKDQSADQEKSQGDKKDKQNSAEERKKELDRKNVERLLEALDRQEEETQKKLLRKKMKSKPSSSTKDW